MISIFLGDTVICNSDFVIDTLKTIGRIIETKDIVVTDFQATAKTIKDYMFSKSISDHNDDIYLLTEKVIDEHNVSIDLDVLLDILSQVRTVVFGKFYFSKEDNINVEVFEEAIIKINGLSPEQEKIFCNMYHFPTLLT